MASYVLLTRHSSVSEVAGTTVRVNRAFQGGHCVKPFSHAAVGAPRFEDDSTTDCGDCPCQPFANLKSTKQRHTDIGSCLLASKVMDHATKRIHDQDCGTKNQCGSHRLGDFGHELIPSDDGKIDLMGLRLRFSHS